MKYYYYKGVKLPDINTVWTDKETYPYAFIMCDDFPSYYLTLCAYLPVFTADRGLLTRNVFKRYVPNNRTDEDGVPERYWSFGYERNDPNETYSTGKGFTFLWTNSDILYDGRSTIYLAASKPISDGEYGMIPLVHYEAACDAIRTKNGKTDLIKSGDMASEIKKPSQFRKKLIERTLDGDLKKEDLEGVTIINGTAFEQCKIVSVDIPDSVAIIAASAFRGCRELRTVVLQDSLKELGDFAFYNCVNLTTITMPESLSFMGGNVFHNCHSLQKIIFPEGIDTIKDGTFEDCTALSDVYIPNTVKTIGDSAFGNCTSLTTIDMPNSITIIASNAFEGCTNLTTINVPWEEGKVENAPWGATNATVHYNYALDLSYELLNDGTYSVSGIGANTSTEVNIPSSYKGVAVTSIGDNAFSGCSNLTSITIPDSVTSIGNGAFQYCSSLTSIDIPNSVTSIDNHAFNSCHSLTSITIPNSVNSIGNYTFWNCSGLTSIVIHNGVTSIGSHAFEGCSNLTNVYYTGTEEQWAVISIDSSGNDCLNNATINYNHTNSES